MADCAEKAVGRKDAGWFQPIGESVPDVCGVVYQESDPDQAYKRGK